MRVRDDTLYNFFLVPTAPPSSANFEITRNCKHCEPSTPPQSPPSPPSNAYTELPDPSTVLRFPTASKATELLRQLELTKPKPRPRPPELRHHRPAAADSSSTGAALPGAANTPLGFWLEQGDGA